MALRAIRCHNNGDPSGAADQSLCHLRTSGGLGGMMLSVTGVMLLLWKMYVVIPNPFTSAG